MAGSTTLRFPDPLKAEAQAYADALGVSLNALCAVALRDYLDARKLEALKAGPAAPPAKVGPQVTPARAAATGKFQLKGPTTFPRVGANQPCPCGSGEKYKRCHGKPGA